MRHNSMAEDGGSVDSNLPPFLIPHRHSTTTNRMLNLPQVKALVGEYPDDFFYTVEARNPLPSGLDVSSGLPNSFPAVTSDTDRYIHHYFADVHPSYPILEKNVFLGMYEGVVSKGLAADLESAVFMAVVALGAIAGEAPTATDSGNVNSVSSQHIGPALKIMMHYASWSLLPDILLPQALLLGALYFAYAAKPLHSWRLVFLSSTNLQHMMLR